LIPAEEDSSGGNVNLTLKGIIYSAGKSVAIINDEVVSEKDKVAGFTVTKIEQKRVILEKDSKQIILKLEGE
jgi:hypothetical protein